MKKGIWIGNGLDFYDDLRWLKDLGFELIYIGLEGGIEEQLKKYNYAKSIGFTDFLVDLRLDEWKTTINLIDSAYYYIDEPYIFGRSDDYIIEKRDYILFRRPSSKLVVGDVRHIQKTSYKPIDGVYYTYTAYTNNWKIDLFGLDLVLPFGGPDQSPSIKRIYKKTGGRVPFIWVYGQNKIFCHPDEYSKLYQTCEDLGINIMILYLGDGASYDSKYFLNRVSESELLENINNFIHNKRPYTIFSWLSRFFRRLYLSLQELKRTKDLKHFINTLF